MAHSTPATAESLYQRDETAWADQTAALVAERRWDEIDADNLSEFLRDMARRDRREVHSRLASLLTHLLKWEFQPDRRSNSWQATIALQRKELGLLLESGTLRNHADEIFDEAYRWAVNQAAVETGLAESTFPAKSPWAIEAALGEA